MPTIPSYLTTFWYQAPSWDHKMNYHKIWVYYIQNDRAEHTDSTKKREIEKKLLGQEIRENVSKIPQMAKMVKFWQFFLDLSAPLHFF